MPAAALANAYDDTLKEYRSTGAVDGCKYTAEQLAQAKDETPANIKDVAPGYPAQLAVAAAKRAKGCTEAEEKASSASSTAGAAPAGTDTGSGAGSGATTQAPAATDTGATTQPPATTTIAPNAPQTAATPAPAPAATQAATQSESSHRGARLALLVLAALVVILLALWAAARWWAWEPHWLVRWRHATAEAGWRASAAWAEFTDWLRLGR
jgi:cobalamin biosynthesis Mg chelatase CobN